MSPELLALSAALCYASGGIAIKFATRTGNILFGYFLSLATSIMLVGAVAWVTVEDWAVPWSAAALFATAGVAGPGAGRLLAMRAVRDAGASVAVPVQSSANPLLASAAGIVLFGETAGLGRLVALALIIAGIWACARGGSANRAPVGDPADSGLARAGWLVLLLPLSVGVVRAAATTVQKSALILHGEPALGALIGLAVAFSIWGTVFATRARVRRSIRLELSLGWFCASGLLSTSGMILVLTALRSGDLTVVAPIVATQPVFVILLSALLLRDLERVRLGTALGGLSVFAGMAYLALA